MIKILDARSKKPGSELCEILIFLTFLLTSFGLISIFAASSLKGSQLFHNEFYFFFKQLAVSLIGFILICALLFTPFQLIEKSVLPSLALVFLLLLLIFVPGVYHKVGGASRWLNIPYIGGQPSEFAKLALVLFLSKNLSRPSHDIQKIGYGIFSNLGVLGFTCGLLLFQKDLGTPILLVAITLSMLIVSGLSMRYLSYVSVGLLATFLIAIFTEPYRLKRLISYLDPWSEAHGQGFQIIQSFVAFANGGLLGTGLGESKQKLFFLPEAHTDFIISVIAEETGIFGLFTLLGCYVALTLIGFKIVSIQTSPFRQFLAFGITIMLNFQALFNAGVAMGLLPTKGMPLPFISSGSSSLLTSLIAVGLLAKIAKETPTLDERT